MAYPMHADSPTRRSVPASPNLPEVERRVLDYWAADKTFAGLRRRPRGRRERANEYVFYDGPPFANGLPHYGHLLTGYVKDVVPRYQTMRGRRVERRFGWDCHGLPAEVEAEKQLGLTTKQEILELGVAKFNDACHSSVLRYTQDWERYVTRQARWVDFANDYKTLDLSYMESVMWAFKTLHDKGLVYEGFRVLAYCWRCETPLSQHRDPDGRRLPGPAGPGADRVVHAGTADDDGRAAGADSGLDHHAVDAAVQPRPRGRAATSSTPCSRSRGEKVYVGRRPGGALRQGAGGLRRGPARCRARRWPGGGTRRCSTSWSTRPARTRTRCCRPTSSPPRTAPALSTVHRRSVRTTRPCATPTASRHWSPWTITPGSPRWSPPYEGQQVFEANKPITRDLKERGVVVRHDVYTHSYPHCWRCDTPLVYKAVSSWFVAVTTFRDRMVELNQQITWMPGHVKDGSFGKWLANARDWSISRNRFWGSPIPVWKSDDPTYPRVDVYGSLAAAARPTSA